MTVEDAAVSLDCRMKCGECSYDGACGIPDRIVDDMLDEKTISMNYLIDSIGDES